MSKIDWEGMLDLVHLAPAVAPLEGPLSPLEGPFLTWASAFLWNDELPLSIVRVIKQTGDRSLLPHLADHLRMAGITNYAVLEKMADAQNGWKQVMATLEVFAPEIAAKVKTWTHITPGVRPIDEFHWEWKYESHRLTSSVRVVPRCPCP